MHVRVPWGEFIKPTDEMIAGIESHDPPAEFELRRERIIVTVVLPYSPTERTVFLSLLLAMTFFSLCYLAGRYHGARLPRL